MAADDLEKLLELEQRIAKLTEQLATAKEAVQQWSEANKSLTLSAAQERAKNQGTGRGFLGDFLGPKFRSAMRASAAASNAALAKDVAEKRVHIANGKQEAQEIVRQIQEELSNSKQQQKLLTSTTKAKTTARVAKAKAAYESLDLLHKLNEAKQAGLLTQEEFEEKRKKLIDDL